MLVTRVIESSACSSRVVEASGFSVFVGFGCYGPHAPWHCFKTFLLPALPVLGELVVLVLDSSFVAAPAVSLVMCFLKNS